MRIVVLAVLLPLCSPSVFAQAPVLDVHVHLREGEASLKAYRDDVAAADLKLSGLAAMWFGGPYQARECAPADVRARNDALIALAGKHADVVAVGTVHPYDGQAALDEVARIASRGVKMLKLHAHTQRFDVA